MGRFSYQLSFEGDSKPKACLDVGTRTEMCICSCQGGKPTTLAVYDQEVEVKILADKTFSLDAVLLQQVRC